MDRFDLTNHGIRADTVLRNAAPARLYELALAHEPGTAIADSGALVALSGERTGRSPRDKRVTEVPGVTGDVWWGPVNTPIRREPFQQLREHARAHLQSCDRLYVVDGFAGWDPRHRIRVRVICERAYHALFMHNMLIRPSADELAGFGEPDYVIYNAGSCDAPADVEGVQPPTSVSLCLEEGAMVILGTEYAGEMKKGVFTIVNHVMPKRGILSMHCSATAGAGGDVSVFFGLSGTGKTTLSADPHRALIGDDEHCWTDDGIFNIEGGCYAKVINLSAAAEPEIHAAVRFGAVLENVVIDEETRAVDFDDDSITANTRCAYPIDYIPNARVPGTAGIPHNVTFLTCDAFSVLPPVSRLTPAQAMYHFISGYTAKVAGTEVGVTEPEATFSACFGAPFLVLHPMRYAEMLAQRIRTHDVNAWLVNTGWVGGPCGVGQRMGLAHTRAIIDAIHDGSLADSQTITDPVFGLAIPKRCPGVPDELLIPERTWSDPAAYRAGAEQLAAMFRENFAQFADQAGPEVAAAGPAVDEKLAADR